MLHLDFHLAETPLRQPAIRQLSEWELREGLAYGSVVLRLDSVDLSANWGWVPLVDFAVCLRHALEELRTGSDAFIDFTENEEKLRFRREGGVVHVWADYAPGRASVPLRELEEGASAFVRRLRESLMSTYPELRETPSFAGLLPPG